MASTARRPEAWLVMLGSTSLIGWSLLALDGSGLTLPLLCSTGRLPTMPLSASLDLALAFNSPLQLVSGWALMVAAMMSTLIMAPLQHVRDRSFANRRNRAMLLFVSGYMALWLIVGAALLVIAFALRSVLSAPPAVLGLAVTLATFWQVSPAKQWCLNRCHRRPQLAAFGVKADRDAFAFGLSNGAACAGACWALMLLTHFVERGHMFGMIAVALLVFAERLESPAVLSWRWRGPGKALRIVMAQARLRLIRPKPQLQMTHQSAQLWLEQDDLSSHRHPALIY